ncbi:MAG: energy transducer TonB [Bacteroidaceae bacterium]|jgi:protein TonB|nr:energy transducer TonB [Bacteroidaceae bacterium]
MEIKKSQRADLEGQKSTGLLIGYIVTLAAVFVAFEYTTRDYVETDVVYSTSSFVSEEEVVPITQPIFTAAPPPPAEAPQVAEILDIVDNNTEIVEEEIESTESTTDAVSGPVAHVSGPAMGPPAATQEEGDEGEVFEIVEQNPMFPGGNEALMKWLSKNLKYPASAQENGIQGRVLVQFVVNKDGSIVEPKVIRSVDPALDKEALRVVSAMPKWQPGKQRGKTVRVRFTLPVTFRLM